MPATPKSATDTAAAPLLRAKEVARLLAVSERTVWTLVARGDLCPVDLPTRTTRFDPADVAALIARARDARGA